MRLSLSLFALLTLGSLTWGDDTLLESSLEELLDMSTELKAEVGSRSGAQNFLTSRAPVDIITQEQIRQSGHLTLSNVLRYAVAGFNAPNTSVADGSDHIRAFTLRGMSPDQVLVLIDGKRLHTSSLLHVNGTIGRGASGVDLETIPLSAIERIEILRDGAAAQYGSDAISGVINIILKGYANPNSASLHTGIRTRGDGKEVMADGFYSHALPYEGFVNLTLQALAQEQTQRAGLDSATTPPRVTTHAGLPDVGAVMTTLNLQLPQSQSLTYYANAIASYRSSSASAFYRADNNLSLLFEDGFLPLIHASIIDFSTTVGVRGETPEGYLWDISNVIGYNTLHYNSTNTMNYDLNTTSPKSFYLGALGFLQNTLNADLKKEFGTLDTALGAEYRWENYTIGAGDSASYTGSGAQGFAGYRAENATSQNRHSIALYSDLIAQLTEKLSLEGALRYEYFTDFGSTLNAKLSSSIQPIDGMTLRASASNGFRAPSLSQSSYSHTSTFGGAVQGTFTPSHAVAQSLGAVALRPENSLHATLGSVYQFSGELSLMADYFYTYVADRIMLSNELGATTAEQNSTFATYGVSKARFFTNAVDTQTQGVDIKLDFMRKLDQNALWGIAVWYHYNNNSVVAFNGANFNRTNSFEQIDRIENGQPKHHLKATHRYNLSAWQTTLHLNAYSSYAQVINDVQYTFAPSWTADMAIAYTLSSQLKLTLGGENIFDSYPSKWSVDSINRYYGANAIKPYSRYSPFGYSGAYYYLRALWEL
ncbi:MAG: hypothetical protein KU37_04420 [Sulfuricurvum sp. PC08-66]|nr:MAG: hypothetical protein KU37_04420 [Sulfuricurvum sp. PC08-66]